MAPGETVAANHSISIRFSGLPIAAGPVMNDPYLSMQVAKLMIHFGGPLGNLGTGYPLQVRPRTIPRTSGFPLLSLAGRC